VEAAPRDLGSHPRLCRLSHHHTGLSRESLTTSLSKRNPAITGHTTRRTRIIAPVSIASWRLAQLWHLSISFFFSNSPLAIVSPRNQSPKFKIWNMAGSLIGTSCTVVKPLLPTFLWKFCERSSYIALNRIKPNLVNWLLFVATGGLLSPQLLIYGPP